MTSHSGAGSRRDAIERLVQRNRCCFRIRALDRTERRTTFMRLIDGDIETGSVSQP